MSTWVTLSGGEAWAFQLDGVIHRVGYVCNIYTDGNMLMSIKN